MFAIAGSIVAAGCADDTSPATTTAPATTTTESETEPETDTETEPDTETDTETEADTEPEPETDTEPETEAESVADTCDWDSARLSPGDTSAAPTGTAGKLSETIIGSWQHTHIDTGAGFEPLKSTTDIRFVLSPDRFLYCQDVEGATDHSENSAPLRLDGSEIVLPSPATGYGVTAWDDDAMVWINHRDGSLYLLVRR